MNLLLCFFLLLFSLGIMIGGSAPQHLRFPPITSLTPMNAILRRPCRCSPKQRPGHALPLLVVSRTILRVSQETVVLMWAIDWSTQVVEVSVGGREGILSMVEARS